MMHPYDKRSLQQPERPSNQRMDLRTRLVIIGCILLLVTYFAWPFMRDGLGSSGQERWRWCHDTSDGEVCTPWQTGPAPREYGGR
jgi:hypothetical protein